MRGSPFFVRARQHALNDTFGEISLGPLFLCVVCNFEYLTIFCYKM